MANLIDRVIGWVSPSAGLSRHFARRQLQRAYEAASPGDRWRPRRAGASANSDHLADAAILRAKARSLVQNVPYIRAGLEALVSATIGTGILPRATGREADTANALFAEWAKVCDADGRLDFAGIEAAAYRAMEQDGEVLIRLRPRLASDNLPVPLQLQLLEIDWLDSTRTVPLAGGNRIVNGIEYDVLGSVVAYWLWSSHPGDASSSRGMRVQSKRIEASSIIHLYTTERPGQGRGFTRFAPVIATVRDLQLYEDAEIARKNQESRLGVVYSGDINAMSNPGADGQPLDAAAKANGELGDLPSGGFLQLPFGSNVSVIEPRATPGYTEYVKQKHHIIAAGIGVTYEMLTGDMNEVNFSSARVRRLDFRRTVEQMQWLTLKPKMLDRIYVAFVDAAVLARKLRSRDYSVDYSVPKWDYVNPKDEVDADLAEISGGLSSISEKLRQRGYNPDVVFKELAADIGKLKTLGILDTMLFLQTKKPADGADPKAAAAGGQRSTDALLKLLERMDTRLQGLEQRSTEINLTTGGTSVTMPERSVTVEAAQQTINVAPAAVNHEIRNEVNVAPANAPDVHIVNELPGTEVRVVNEVQPAEVQLTMRATERTTDVEYENDPATGKRRIKRTVSTEKPI